jgi:transcriptional regulator with XRE-family HTH domain
MNEVNQNAIRHKIRSLGISQYELAGKSGVPQSSISKFLSGKTITTRTLEKLWPVIYGNSPEPAKAEA